MVSQGGTAGVGWESRPTGLQSRWRGKRTDPCLDVYICLYPYISVPLGSSGGAAPPAPEVATQEYGARPYAYNIVIKVMLL